MADRMTNIRLPGVFGAGYADYGRKTVPEMLAAIRRYASEQKALAEAILAAADGDFTVSTYVGVHRRRDRVVLQHAAKGEDRSNV